MANEYAHFRSDSELHAGVRMWQVISPFLMIFGTFGNVLSIMVLSRPRFSKWASSVYLLGLAVSDLCILYVGLLRQWVKYTLDWDIRNASVVTCKVHWWLMYSTADCSVWILTAITVERLISTLCPYKSKSVCTRKISKITLMAIVCSALLINSHLLYGFGQLEIPDGNSTMVIPCAPLEDYEMFFTKIWTWIDLCKYSLVPFAILASGNVCIIYKVCLNQRKVKNQNSDPNEKQKVSNMSILLISLNCVFIVCTLPVCIYFIGEPYWIPDDVPRSVQLEDPWWAFVNLIMYVNNSGNFILYCVTGSRFRQTVKEVLKCRIGRGTRIHATASMIGTANTSSL